MSSTTVTSDSPPMSSDSAGRELKEAKEKRSSQQGVTRGFINRINQFMVTDDLNEVKLCEDVLVKLQAAIDKFELSHANTIGLCERYNHPTSDLSEKAIRLRKDTKAALFEGRKWIYYMNNQREDEAEESFMDSTIIESSPSMPFESDVSVISAGDGASQAQMLLRMKDGEIESLKAELDKVRMSAVNERQKMHEEIDDVKDAMRLQSRESNVESQVRDDRISYLEKLVSDVTREKRDVETRLTDARSRGDNMESTRVPDNLGDTTISQADLLALSTVIGQSNASVFQKVLDETANRQKTLFDQVTGPKPALITFDGDRTHYYVFMNRYDEMIGNTTRSYASKLSTLLEYCSEDVRAHLDSCNYKPARQGYEAAKQILLERYGDPYLISQAWIEKLMAFPKLKGADAMMKFSTVLNSAHETLISLGYVAELTCTRTMRDIYDKLPFYVQNRWLTLNRDRAKKGRKATLQEMQELISNAAAELGDPIYGSEQAFIEEKPKKREAEKEKSKTNPKKKNYKTETTDDDTGARPERKNRGLQKSGNPAKSKPNYAGMVCVMCSKEHPTYRCFLYKELGSDERLAFVKTNHLCTRCIEKGHVHKDCPKNWTCLMNDCDEPHHYSLHRALLKSSVVSSDQNRRVTAEATSGDVSLNKRALAALPRVADTPIKPIYMGIRLNPDFALPVVPVNLIVEDRVYATYALIDTGSAVTMVSGRAMNIMHMKPVARTNMILQGVVSEMKFDTVLVDVRIQGTKYSQEEEMKNVVVNAKLDFGTDLPREMKRYKEWDHLKHLDLEHHDNNRVDVLIGQDQAFLIVQQDLIEGPNKYYPYGVKTRLGWTMFGHFGEKVGTYQSLKATAQREDEQILDDNSSLEQTLQVLWEIEAIPESLGHSPINKKILKLWDKETVLRDGHYQVPIPFKREPPRLPNNYVPVKRRLDALRERLKKNDDLRQQYVEAMKISIQRGVLERAPEIQDPEYLWFNTHHAVLSDTRSTRCRVVGNLSCRHKNVSLNDVVHQGPNMANPLVQVMVAFRVYRYVITGDVEKMFHQVYVPERQRDSLSLLWYEDSDIDKQVVVYRNKSQMFGGVWSPSASIYAMNRAATDFGQEYDPIVEKTVKGNFYVDDLLKSILSISIGIRLIRDLRHMLSRASFNLVKLGSNSIEILEQIPDDLRSKNYDEIEFVINAEVQDKTLGSLWRPGKDTFGFTCLPTAKPCTRRGLLSTYSSIYDPLGFVGPFVLVAKMLIQELCRLKLPWDQQLDEEYVTRWLLWRDQVPELQSFVVDRWLGVTDEANQDYQIHLFADASEQGYGVVAYLCVLDDTGEITGANLIMSKSRVAPIQAMSIPRLELTAAVTAARLEDKLVEYLDISLLPSVFWCDSQIVLYYIKQQSREFKTFVANRIALIQDLTDPEQWRFVPGVLNIADVASRGCTVFELKNKEEWLTGPAFLYDRREWPKLLEEFQEDTSDLKVERRVNRTRVCFTRMKEDHSASFLRFLSCFSEWNKLFRAIASLKRLSKCMKGEKFRNNLLSVNEYLEAEAIVVQHVQKLCITDSQLKSHTFKKLFPFDNEGVLRVGGRLLMSSLRFEEKYPVIFPKSDQAKMYVRHVHARLGHPGVDRTYMEVRKYYWLLGGRRYVKEILNDCVLCRKLKSNVMQQQMAPLPKHRVEPGTAPFEHIGVDYCGPIAVKIGRSMIKRYICVITCFQTRAMHLEMAAELTTSSFLNALQRFISRRGKPVTITSDNGTNFVGANREIRKVFDKWNQRQIHDYLLQRHIEWQFNTPGASHHGGVWERQIRSVRNLMLSLITEQVLTDEALNTYLCVIEEIVNSRPLTKINEDSQDLLPLTPNHLLMLRQTGGLVGDYEQADTLQRRWRQLQYLADLFWKKWSRTYLRDLQVRSKWTDQKNPIKKGDLVMLVDERTSRLDWPMALVLEVFPGKDGLIRSVKIRTKEGIYERPISKLVLLECN